MFRDSAERNDYYSSEKLDIQSEQQANVEVSFFQLNDFCKQRNLTEDSDRINGYIENKISSLKIEKLLSNKDKGPKIQE